MPTLWPAKNFVPHCRTMMEPAFTDWPPNSFTLLYCGLLSRPFLEEPCPFLCAIANCLSFDKSKFYGFIITAPHSIVQKIFISKT